MRLPEQFDARFVRVLAALIAPGAVALVPWLLVAGKAYPEFSLWLFAGDTLSIATLVVWIFCTGMVLENFGSRLELRLDREHDIDQKAWESYLQQKKDELVGHGYISSLVTRLKFELGMVFALPLAAAALGILAFCQNGMPHIPAALLIPAGLFGAIYFRLEAGKAAHRLNLTRCSLTASTKVRPPDADVEQNPVSSRSVFAGLWTRKRKDA